MWTCVEPSHKYTTSMIMIKKAISIFAISGSLLLPNAAFAQTATYYSDTYQGASTASGEPYNSGAMTAAHPSLPFGTRVVVTNLNNGRSVTVRINDRCGCSIDLSRAAAQQIGMISSGVAPVSIKVSR
jgi:rare lipoprotein A